MKKSCLITLTCLLFASHGIPQTTERVHYDEHDGLSHRHVTQILQDQDGFIWLSTWNGLDRFDGRGFVTFKSRAGDGVDMPSDRFRNIALDRNDPRIINCRVDDSWFRFSLTNGKFQPVGEQESKALSHHPGKTGGKFVGKDGAVRFSFRDRQGLWWNIVNDGIDLIIPRQYPITADQWQQPAEVKSIFTDKAGRTWITSKEDQTVRLLDHGTVGFIAPDGTVTHRQTPFGVAVYCAYQSADGDMWLGCKPDGLFRLRDGGGRFLITHITETDGGLPSGNVYDVKEDRYGRMWIATMGGGVACMDHGKCTVVKFGKENKARRLFVVDDSTIVAATTEGLLVIVAPNSGKMQWRLHRREPRRASSLSNNACMDFARIDGKWLVATESGGINEITSPSITANELSFRHFDEQTGLGSDVILSIVPFNAQGRELVLAVSNNTLILLDPRSGESRELSQQAFPRKLSFSDARPAYISSNGKWMFGLNDGLATIENGAFDNGGGDFPIVLTSLTIENNPTDYTVNQLDEITLTPTERTVAVTFAVLDYRNPKAISYAYRINGDADWHYLGNNNSVLLSELAPGDYELELRATNALGKWSPKIRTLKIAVEPKFTETAWFQLLIVIIIIGMLSAVALTRRYIKNIQKKQKETLDAYLALLDDMSKANETSGKPHEELGGNVETNGEKTAKTQKTSVSSTKLSLEDSALMTRIVAFTEEHLSDSAASVDDMAAAAAVSRSSLNRKMKSIVGVTPADFIREARVKRACALLKSTDTTVSDIAYQCGFTDPKYFSRVFRQSTGMPPSDYRAMS